MKIEIIKCLKDNYSYLIIDENKDACVVDPGEADPVIEKVNKLGLKLKFILTTHHHNDHVGGNNKIKEKLNCKVVGFIKDKHRIPSIDILVKDKEICKFGNFEFEVFHVPGHTSGHISFYFFKSHFLFTGDTLFSLGCGRIFEGTYEEMYESLKIFKNLPKRTLVYFGHEYTKQNSKFCLFNEPNNLKLKKKMVEIDKKLSLKFPTCPTTLKDELETNIFLRSKNLQNFSKMRELKDNF